MPWLQKIHWILEYNRSLYELHGFSSFDFSLFLYDVHPVNYPSFLLILQPISGGKHLHIEKFAIRKARSFLANDKFLCLPGIELLYIWRFIPLMGKEQQEKLVQMLGRSGQGAGLCFYRSYVSTWEVDVLLAPLDQPVIELLSHNKVIAW